MRWKIMLQCETDAGEVTTTEVMTLERNIRPEFSQMGLLHREGKTILLRLQRMMMRNQASEFFKHSRPCRECGVSRNIKDYRKRTLQTIYGNVEFKLPRFQHCPCASRVLTHCFSYVWLGSLLIPSRSTPELMAMQAGLGARVPYREAAFLMNAFLPAQRARNHGTVRNHTLRVGEKINLEGCAVPDRSASPPSDTAVVAIDGTYARGRRSDEAARFEIIAGRVTVPQQKSTLFSFVQNYQPDPSELRQMWEKLGCGESTYLRIVTDGDTGLRNIVQNSAPGSTGHVLDWFHIAMRLQAIRRSIRFSLLQAQCKPSWIGEEEREVESISHHIWHGDLDIACELLEAMASRIEWTVDPAQLKACSLLRSNLQRVRELRKYLRTNQDEVIAYSIAHRDKEPVSTAPVESTINHLINHRMNKSQQMSWTARGAHYMLQVRVAIANRVLGPIFSRWYPGFSTPDPQLSLRFSAV